MSTRKYFKLSFNSIIASLLFHYKGLYYFLVPSNELLHCYQKNQADSFSLFETKTLVENPTFIGYFPSF